MPEAAKQPTVLKKLRRQFVFTNMLFVVIILAVVWALMFVVNTQQRTSEVDVALENRARMISEQPGGFGGQAGQQGAGGQLAGTEDELGEMAEMVEPPEAPDGMRGGGPGGMPQREFRDDQIIATSVFVVDEEGNLQQVVEDPLGLDATSRSSAIATAITVWSNNSKADSYGNIQDLGLRYMVKAQAATTQTAQAGTSQATVLVVLASQNYVDQAQEGLLRSLGIASVIALVTFFLLSLFLSRWALGPVQRAWNQQQQFVADASHELKTPLTVIMANNSLLMSNPEATVEEQMQWVESTQSEAQLMQGLVNDMLYLARSEGDQQQLEMAPVDLSDLVRSSALQFEAVAFERGVQLQDEIASGITVRGNAEHLARLVGVLLDNACKYANEGGSVAVALSTQGNKAQLAVHNTGSPILAEDLPHLFDRFYRVDKARTRGAGGFGLGLAIAHNIATAHGGDIQVKSTADEGTTFTVVLPL